MTHGTAHPRTCASASLRIAATAAAIVVAVTGCAHSPPTRYVTLNAAPGAAPLATVQIQPVQLTAVHIPAELDRLEVVTQPSPNRLAIDGTDRWGAPLAQMMRRTLAQDLMTRLPPGAFIVPDAPAPPDTRTLVVTVLDSQADASGTLTLQAAWTLLAGHPAHAVLTQQATLTSAMSARDAPAQAAALSRILGQLADQIATRIVGR
ncbi:ABC-type transport auxiliary lipoprotein family protein [Paraburkholderia sp. MPAMCS5]|uniref:PqiC family protein n=1 Tax=Paraburkholderia sp. MPAMCS5 TaxID=3112563 RepID=UPI002E171D81|nr:ABC-type transport auxiliary lipoprotein family protein [Paraburkholderia sp. MPAMCS5]